MKKQFKFNRIFLVLLFAIVSTGVRYSFAQTVSVFSSEEGSKNTLIELVYTERNKFKLVKTLHSEPNNFVGEKVIINDTIYCKLKNYIYLINLSRFDINKYKGVSLFFRFINKNELLLRKLNPNSTVEYYRYKIKERIPKFSPQ